MKNKMLRIMFAMFAVTLLLSGLSTPTVSHASTVSILGDSGGGGASRCFASDKSGTLKSGSKILLPGGNSNYGYCHIQELHMVKKGGSYKGKTQFNKFLDEGQLFSVAKSIVDSGTNGDSTKKGNYVKEKYVSSLNQNVRVIYTTYKGSKYKYSITSAYPIKRITHPK